MEESAADDGALFEAVAFLSYFHDLPDGRQSGKVVYPPGFPNKPAGALLGGRIFG